MKLAGNDAALAVDIGGSKIVAGIVDPDGGIVRKERECLADFYTKEAVMETVLRLSKAVLDGCDRNIRCAGATIPGLADAESGMWVYASFSGIRDFPIARAMADALHMPVFIENDVNACALGEIRYGSCKDVKDFIWITVSNGIGGCVVSDGRIYRGFSKNAGEIGHINVAEDGYQCKCGNRGCAEMYAAGPGIVRRYLEASGASPVDPAIDAKHIAELAKGGDPLAMRVYEDTGYYLGKAIAAAVNVVNPQKVILGGGVGMDMELFYPQMIKTASDRYFRDANGELTIEKTALSYEAGLIGAASIAFSGWEAACMSGSLGGGQDER